MALEFQSHPFWDYSLAVYRRDGMSPALITFQDRHGLDVNILLLSLWVGQSGRGILDEADFAHVLGVSANWNPEIVCAVRAVRIRLREQIDLVPKELSDVVRKELLGLEIECEHVEQLSLVAGLGEKEIQNRSSEEKLKDCGLNFKSYFSHKGCNPDADDRRELVTILSAAFDDSSADLVKSFCEDMFA
jgi:uncharacterized protein (TIGR02444 family)